MGSKRLHKKTQDFVLVFALAAIVSSCLPPGMHIEFMDEHGSHDKLKMKLADNRVQVEMSSFSSVGVYCERYELSLYVRVKPLEKGHAISIAPEKLSALVGDSVMIVHRDYPEHRVDRPSDHEFRVDANFELLQDLHFLPSRGVLPVRIVLDDFIFVDGEPVVVDTIQAIESQWCE